jgi:hypothetical protein
MEKLPPELEAKRGDLERALGRPVHVRGVRTPDLELRGRLRVERDRVVIEYQISEHGYFWHIPIIEELFDRAAAGHSSFELRAPSPGPEAEPQEG